MAYFFIWPEMKNDVKKYVSQCDVSQRVESDSRQSNGLMQPLLIPVKNMGGCYHGFHRRIASVKRIQQDSHWEVLVEWEDLPLEDATWEQQEMMRLQFSDFIL